MPPGGFIFPPFLQTPEESNGGGTHRSAAIGQFSGEQWPGWSNQRRICPRWSFLMTRRADLYYNIMNMKCWSINKKNRIFIRSIDQFICYSNRALKPSKITGGHKVKARGGGGWVMSCCRSSRWVRTLACHCFIYELRLEEEEGSLLYQVLQLCGF